MHYSLEHWIEQGSSALDACNYELAQQILTRAVDIHPDNAPLLELLGIAEIECAVLLGDDQNCIDRAIMNLERAVILSPDLGSSKYFYLGQFTCGLASIRYLERGAAILEQEFNASKSGRKLAQALCSIIEVYMTDCCDEPDAESKCESYIRKALLYDPGNTEVHQSHASILLSQCNTSKAAESILIAISLWTDKLSTDTDWPTLAVRVAQSKILMEVSLIDDALKVLKTCQLENDADIETWYLYGWCYFLSVCGAECDLSVDLIHTEESQLDILEDARDCFVYLLQKTGEADTELIEHAYGLLVFTNRQLLSNGRVEIEMDGVVDMVDEDGWDDEC